MDPTHLWVSEELDRLEEVLSWTPAADLLAAFCIGRRFLNGLELEPELSTLVAKRLSAIRAKYGV